MSLVGPRPLPVYEVEEFEKSTYRRRMSVKPGITCTWQAGGRNSITNFDDWIELDLEYIDNWSLWYDIKILFKTIPAVLFGSGAKSRNQQRVYYFLKPPFLVALLLSAIRLMAHWL